MQPSRPTLLLKKDISKSFSQKKTEIVPYKREAEEPIENQFLMKARYTETLYKIELVSKWSKKPEQPSSVSQQQEKVENTIKQDKPSIVPGNAQQISKDEKSNAHVQQNLEKQIQDVQQEKLENSQQQVDPQKHCLEHLQKPNTVNESQEEKIQSKNNKNNQQDPQKTSQNQESNEDSKGRKSQISISAVSSTKTDPLNHAQQKKRIKPNKIYCKFFPHCEKKDCQFKHPKIQCKFFPNCSQGIACMYTHKDCRYWDKCTKPSCIYNHPPRNLLQKYKKCPTVAQAFIKKAAKNLMTVHKNSKDSKNKK